MIKIILGLLAIVACTVSTPSSKSHSKVLPRSTPCSHASLPFNCPPEWTIEDEPTNQSRAWSLAGTLSVAHNQMNSTIIVQRIVDVVSINPQLVVDVSGRPFAPETLHPSFLLGVVVGRSSLWQASATERPAFLSVEESILEAPVQLDGDVWLQRHLRRNSVGDDISIALTITNGDIVAVLQPFPLHYETVAIALLRALLPAQVRTTNIQTSSVSNISDTPAQQLPTHTSLCLSAGVRVRCVPGWSLRGVSLGVAVLEPSAELSYESVTLFTVEALLVAQPKRLPDTGPHPLLFEQTQSGAMFALGLGAGGAAWLLTFIADDPELGIILYPPAQHSEGLWTQESIFISEEAQIIQLQAFNGYTLARTSAPASQGPDVLALLQSVLPTPAP